MSLTRNCTIIVLSYNNIDIISECLARAEKSARFCEKKLGNKVDIVVIDNASTDGSGQVIKTAFPKVKLLAQTTNLGCSRSDNLGMSTSSANYFLHLNSDTFIEPNTVAEAITSLESHPHAGVLTVRQTYADGGFQANCGFLPTPLRTILWTLGLENIPVFKNILRPFYQFSRQFYEQTQIVGWRTTSFFLLRRSVFDTTRGLDQTIMVHMEDVEWCQRIHDAGFQIVYDPHIHITHLGGKTTKKFSKEKLLNQHIQGLKKFHQKHFPTYWKFVKLSLAFGMLLRSLFYSVIRRHESAAIYKRGVKQVVALSLLAITVLCLSPSLVLAANPAPWWPIQSIDTMKYSRDTAGAKVSDSSFDKTIEEQVTDIANTGATHIAIATPYDEQFVTFLARWVAAARRHGLNVWFRGNFSGWEGWFGMPSINREQHKQMTRDFILKHADLFQNGDIFMACPECENGGAGDPRQTGDTTGYQKFLIDLHTIATDAFTKIGKHVNTNLDSMNGDIARLVMDPATTKSLGGIVTVDHYVETGDKLNHDITDFAKMSSGNVVLGEFGAPIPDIHGNLNEVQQASWIDHAMGLMQTNPHLIGLNYWVSFGGSTQLWNDNGTPRLAVATISKYFKPATYQGIITDSYESPVAGATVQTATHTVTTDSKGAFIIPHLPSETELTITAPGFPDKTVVIADNHVAATIKLQSQESFLGNLILTLREFIHNLLKR